MVGQCLASMAAGYLMDWLRHRMKATILGLLGLAGALFILLALICMGVIAGASYAVIFAVIVAATALNFATCPLLFELCAEIAYPVSEGLVGGFLTTFYNLGWKLMSCSHGQGLCQ